MTESASFKITYRIQTAANESIQSKIEAICLEQTVELPRSVISDDIYDRIVAKPEKINQESESVWYVTARYPLANVGDEITQFLNVLFGNVSLVPGVRVLDVSWSDVPASILPGPAHGIQGVRMQLGVPSRALSCTALKPVGFTSDQLAGLAYEFAVGGIDLIKDDHGLANQVYAPFDERLKRCAEAVNRANALTGGISWYIPHISAPGDELWRRYELAKSEGAGAVMICPQFCSPEVMSEIARQDNSLPIMAHPAFSGSFIMDPSHGFSLDFLYGKLWRAMGADFSIYPNAHGRFSFTTQDCLNINDGCRTNSVPYNSTFPTPGGGMQRETVPTWLETYGNDTVFLIGGSLYRHPDGIRKAASEIKHLLENN
jgi:ribulose-bisphosphate carboxylase large chain